ncbi:oxidoreductase [Magnaporthiopsis poae ATCC 64411]|uniref:Oxidoreductase n=1 Tax=Magnaporthiopsis poae (strain ATCC 64411 / 73-15) TaxID=644358 RepID=A0A0C4EG89_MAGP6|nr:oxidoreductase [Magnaporthiopsis poae ATCC 64411]
MSVNCRGTMISSREEISRMLRQDPLETHDGRKGNRGVIVNICSSGGIASRPSCPAYDASRAAIISLTRADALDYAKNNIRINCVCPGVIDISAEIPNDDEFIADTPMQRVGTSQEVADAVLFLCSSKATFIHGVTLPVDGGYTAG